MGFSIRKEDIAKNQKVPAGMHLFEVTEVLDEYFNDKGTKVQEMRLVDEKGREIRTWFNDKMRGYIIEFVEAADNVKLSEQEFASMDINLKNYIGKKISGSVSHNKDKNGKMQASIDNFFAADKVPF